MSSEHTPHTTQELWEIITDALGVGIGPYSDFPMEEDWRKALAARDSLIEQLEAAREALICLRETTAYDEYGYVKACVEHGLGDDTDWDNWEHPALESNPASRQDG